MSTYAPSSAAERQRRHKARRRAGLFVVEHEIHENDIDELIRAGLLEPGQFVSRKEIGAAVGKAFRSWVEERGLTGANALCERHQRQGKIRLCG